MKHVAFAVMIGLGVLALGQESYAAACANGVYRAGCAGPNGAAVVKRSHPLRCHAPKARTGRDVWDPMGPRSSEGHTRAISSESWRVSPVGPAPVAAMSAEDRSGSRATKL